jgi:phage replication initiation protein
MDDPFYTSDEDSQASVLPGAADPCRTRAERAPAADAAVGSPRLVIRGESYETNTPENSSTLGSAALTDWLNVTFRPIGSICDAETFFNRFSEVTGGIFGGMTDREQGLHGWKMSFAFDRGHVLFAAGGQRGTALLSMPGEGCAFVPDWQVLTRFLQDELAAKITRWDGAVDDFEGKHSVDLAVELYRLGGFKKGGREPLPKQHGNWVTPDKLGRTFEVGCRKNGKLARIYEKGKQLGKPDSPWVRWEVELHPIDRLIPWEVLTQPGQFIAGAYPCCSWVSEQASRIRTIKAQDEISYERLTDAGSIAYGALINTMLQREGSAERVVQILRRDGAPRRLQHTDDYLRVERGGNAL